MDGKEQPEQHDGRPVRREVRFVVDAPVRCDVRDDAQGCRPAERAGAEVDMVRGSLGAAPERTNGGTMKRILAASLLLALAVTSCAARWYTAPATTMSVPHADNFGICAVPQEIAVSDTCRRVMHLRLTQGAFVYEDSLTVTSATASVVFPSIAVPGPALIVRLGWASDVGGTGCTVSDSKSPLVTLKPPAAVVMQ